MSGGEDEHHHQNRHRQRQQDVPERLPGARSIDHGGLLQGAVDGFEVALDGPDMQGHSAERSENQRAMGVDAEPGHQLAEPVEQRIKRHQRQHWREHLENQHPLEQPRLAAKAHTGEGIGTGSGEQQDQHRGHRRHLDRIPEPQEHRKRWLYDAAIGALPGNPQRQRPVLQGEAFGNQVAGGKIALAKGDRDHQQQGKCHQGDNTQQGEMRGQLARTDGTRLNHGHGRILLESGPTPRPGRAAG